MNDIKNKLMELNLLIDTRARILGTAMKRNYTHFNETALDSEKMVPQLLKIEFELNDLPEDVANDIRRIEQVGNAFGVSVEYIKSENDQVLN